VHKMAVTRSFLKGMGLTDEQVGAIIEEHTNTVNGLKEARDGYKAEAEKLANAQKELDALKANNGEDWKTKYDALKKTFDAYKTEVATQAQAEKVKAAYTQLLKDANVDPKRIEAILRITDLSGMKIGEDGKMENAAALTEAIKTEWSAFIQTTGKQGAQVETPPNTHGSATITKADIYAKDERGRYKMTTADRQRALTEHPELLK